MYGMHPNMRPFRQPIIPGGMGLGGHTWEVIQAGTVAVTGSPATATLRPGVDLNECFAYVSTQDNATNGGWYWQLSTTALTITRGTGLAVNPYFNNVYYFVVRVRGLSQPIQHGLSSISCSAGDQFQYITISQLNQDIQVGSFKGLALLNHFGQWISLNVAHCSSFINSRTQLGLRLNSANAASTSFSWTVVPSE